MRTPRAEWCELREAHTGPWTSTRYVRGEFAVLEQDPCVARVQAPPAVALYAQDAARALGIEGLVGVHVGFRWANAAARWEVCRLDPASGEPVGEWVAVPPRTPA